MKKLILIFILAVAFGITASNASTSEEDKKTKKEVTTTGCADKAKTTEKAATTGCAEAQKKSCATAGKSCCGEAKKEEKK